MSQKSKTGTKKIKFNQKVFNLYHSGDQTKSDNIIFKFITYAVIFLLIFFIGGYFFLSSRTSPAPEQSEELSKSVTKVSDVRVTHKKVSNKEDFDITKFTYQEISCFGENCNYDGITIPETVLRFAIRETQSKILESKTNKNLNIKYLYCFLNEDFKNQFNRGQNEKSSSSSIDFFNRN